MKKPPQTAIKLIESQADLFELGTGTNGPVAIRKPQPARQQPRQQPPGRVSYRTALHQITGTVLELLEARGEQWNGDEKQALISTLFIAATKEKRIEFDFTPEEP